MPALGEVEVMEDKKTDAADPAPDAVTKGGMRNLVVNSIIFYIVLQRSNPEIIASVYLRRCCILAAICNRIHGISCCWSGYALNDPGIWWFSHQYHRFRNGFSEFR